MQDNKHEICFIERLTICRYLSIFEEKLNSIITITTPFIYIYYKHILLGTNTVPTVYPTNGQDVEYNTTEL